MGSRAACGYRSTAGGAAFLRRLKDHGGHGVTLGTTSEVHVPLTRIFSPKPENYYIIILTLRY